jgi:lipopolysaccharide/colanic/teichoic acid biosynthesis glycosyltransferase
MNKKSLKRLWTRLRGAELSPGIRGLHSTEQFRAILDRERARSDRNGYVFALLTFAVGDAEDGPARFLPLVGALGKRLRSTDEVGWLDDERIGVVLPDAEETGAWKVADDVLRGYGVDLPAPHCEVFCYPPRRAATDRALPTAAPSVRTGRREARNMETLFVRPMPTWKRGLDLLGGGLGLCLAAPLLVLAAVAIKVTSPGPVLFRQHRRGLGGLPFTMLKLRTMHVDAEARRDELLDHNEQDGPAFKIADDPRVTPVGRFLRQSSLDELPQLWNVLRGEMSLVGPRPLPCAEADACDHWQRRRQDVTPGLTCFWQVQGRSRVTFVEWMRMDLAYVRDRAPWVDLKILLATVPAVLSRRGAR